MVHLELTLSLQEFLSVVAEMFLEEMNIYIHFDSNSVFRAKKPFFGSLLCKIKSSTKGESSSMEEISFWLYIDEVIISLSVLLTVSVGSSSSFCWFLSLWQSSLMPPLLSIGFASHPGSITSNSISAKT